MRILLWCLALSACLASCGTVDVSITELPTTSPDPTPCTVLSTPAATADKPSRVPAAATVTRQILLRVPANVLWCTTSLQVTHGDWLQVTAQGAWYSGIAPTGPEGMIGQDDTGAAASPCGGCPLVDGNLGELVGRIGANADLFRIGPSAVIAARAEGELSLSMNDTLGECFSGRPGSCYDDNSGSMEVTVIVWRP